MKARTKPTSWSLEPMSNEELLRIALGKLRQRTIREGEKMDEKFEAGNRDEKQRSKFYSLWYAFEALRIYASRKRIHIEEPFPKPKSTKEIVEDLLDDFGHEVANQSESRRALNIKYGILIIKALSEK